MSPWQAVLMSSNARPPLSASCMPPTYFQLYLIRLRTTGHHLCLHNCPLYCSSDILFPCSWWAALILRAVDHSPVLSPVLLLNIWPHYILDIHLLERNLCCLVMISKQWFSPTLLSINTKGHHLRTATGYGLQSAVKLQACGTTWERKGAQKFLDTESLYPNFGCKLNHNKWVLWGNGVV